MATWEHGEKTKSSLYENGKLVVVCCGPSVAANEGRARFIRTTHNQYRRIKASQTELVEVLRDCRMRVSYVQSLSKRIDALLTLFEPETAKKGKSA